MAYSKLSGNNSYGQCGRPIIEDEDYFRNRVIHKVKGPWTENDSIQQIICGQDHRLVTGMLYY